MSSYLPIEAYHRPRDLALKKVRVIKPCTGESFNTNSLRYL